MGANVNVTNPTRKKRILASPPVVWSRMELEVHKRDRMPLNARYFDDRGRLARTMAFSSFQTMGGRPAGQVER